MNVPDSVSLAVVAISSSNNKFLGSIFYLHWRLMVLTSAR